MTKEQVAEADAETVEDEQDDEQVAAPDENADPGGSEDARDFESEAREMGWVPQDEWRGDPNRWSDAKTFVEKGETFIPFLQADRRKLQEKLEAKDAEFEQRLKRMEAMSTKREEAIKAQFDNELQRIRNEQRAAVADGDTEKFDALERQRESLSKQSADAFRVEDDEPADPHKSYEKKVADWAAENPWYNENFELATKAENYSQFLMRRNPGMQLEDNLRMTAEYIRKEHPEAYGGKPQRRSPVDSGPQFNSAPNGRKPSKGYKDLPREAQEAAQLDVSQGLFKSKEEWAKEYWEND